MSNFHHDQPRTLVDNGGHQARGPACDGPGSPAQYLASDEEANARRLACGDLGGCREDGREIAIRCPPDQASHSLLRPGFPDGQSR